MRKSLLPLLALTVALPLQAADFRVVSRDGRQTEYDGSVSLSGRFERRQDAETLVWRGDRVCFAPDAASTGRLPPAANAAAARFFCFSNNHAAMAQLKLPAQPVAGACGVSGTATVTVSHYTVESGENVFDQAWLDKVDAATAPAAIPCP